MVELHQDGVMNAFIAIAACAILVYIVYAYNKSRSDNFDNGMLMAPVSDIPPFPRTPLPRTYQPVDYPRLQPAGHLMTVSPGPPDRLRSAPEGRRISSGHRQIPQAGRSIRIRIPCGFHGLTLVGSSLKFLAWISGVLHTTLRLLYPSGTNHGHSGFV
jgi:hypothetical protein